MALTIVPSAIYPNDVWGAIEVRAVTCTAAAADYAAGGYTLTPGQGISLGQIYFVLYLGGLQGFVPVWNPVTQKLQVFTTGTASGDALNEAAAATDLSALPFELFLLGK